MTDAMKNQASRFFKGFVQNSCFGDGPFSNVLLLIGPVKSGKSTLLTKTLPCILLSLAAKNKDTRAPVFFYFSPPIGNLLPEVYMEKLRCSVVDFARLYGLNLEHSPNAVDAVEALSANLISKNRQLVILLDEIQGPVVAECRGNLEAATKFASLFKYLASAVGPGRLILTGSGMISTLLAMVGIASNGTDFFASAAKVHLGQPWPNGVSTQQLVLNAAKQMSSEWSEKTVLKLIAGIEKSPLLAGCNPPLFPRLPLILMALSLLTDDSEEDIAMAVKDAKLKVSTESCKDLTTVISFLYTQEKAQQLLLPFAKLAYREISWDKLTAQERAANKLTETDLVVLSDKVAKGLVYQGPDGPRLLPPYSQMLAEELQPDGALGAGSYLMYKDEINSDLLIAFEDQLQLHKKNDRIARKEISVELMKLLAYFGHGIIDENETVRPPRSPEEAFSMKLFHNTATAFRAAINSIQSMGSPNHILLETFEAYLSDNSRETDEAKHAFYQTIGLDYLVLMRHFSVHMKMRPVEFGKIINNTIGLAPSQFQAFVALAKLLSMNQVDKKRQDIATKASSVKK